ncbi:hypothetical protein TA3x_000532 [Tundrisphaera sp. TA3]|uniref:hypothetical protein n=1 Tax=Tundrisphaera sp. TA3 TaxID=3435775 RepID=UPI003EBAB5F9
MSNKSIGHAKKPPRKQYVEPFFGYAQPTKEQDKFPEHWEQYRRTFVLPADWAKFDLKVGDGIWMRAKGTQKKGGEVVKKWDRPLASADLELERHLSRPHDRPRPYQWLGVYGHDTLDKYCIDLDNHAHKDNDYIDRYGRVIRLGGLDPEYLSRVRRLWAALPPLPTVVVTSSRSLGLQVWQHLPERYDAPRTHRNVTAHLEGNGLPGIEVHPIYNDDGKSCRCCRLPFGDGSYSLTNEGLIRPWHRQLDHFIIPTPLPSFGRVVAMLVGLLREQYEHVRHRRDDLDRQLVVLKDWITSGCPDVAEEPEPRKKPAEKRAAKVSQKRDPAADDLKLLPRQVAVYRLATVGLMPKLLKWSLYTLAKHLVLIERVPHDMAFGVLERWCLDKHNGNSSRIEGGGPLSKDVSSLIGWSLKKAVALEGEIVSRTYSKPLRVRHLVTGEGEPNRYGPPGPLPEYSPHTHTSPLSMCPPSQGGAPKNFQEMGEEYGERIKALVGRGYFDKPLLPEIEDNINKTGTNALPFLRRVANYLKEKGGSARISRELFTIFYGGNSNKQIDKYKAIAKGVGLFQKTDGYRIGKRSTEYTLMVDESRGGNPYDSPDEAEGL